MCSDRNPLCTPKGLPNQLTARSAPWTGNSPGKHVTHARPTPYVASLFGFRTPVTRTPQPPPKKPFVRRRPVRAKQKKVKPSPALLAQKHRPKPARLAQKQGGHKAKLSRTRVKTKSKALLVSEAR